MKRIILLKIISTILLAVLINCEHSKQMPNAYQMSADEKHNIGEIKKTTKGLINKAFYSDEIATGYASVLYLGNTEDYESYIALRFDMSNVPDSSIIRSAKLALFAADVLGDSVGAFPASVHGIKSSQADWEENKLKWSDFQHGYDEAQIVGENPDISATLTDTIISDQDTTISTSKDMFTIDIGSIINPDSLIDTNFASQGLCIRTDETGLNSFLKAYYSAEYSTASVRPYLEVISVKDTTLDTTQITPSHDTFIARRKQLVDADSSDCLFTGQGVPFRSLLKFDFSDISDKNAKINRAQLKLVLNRDKSLLSNFDNPNVKVFRLENWPEGMPESAETDSSSTAGVIGTVSNDTISVEVASLVQDFATLQYENIGFLIRSLDESYGLYRSVFHATGTDSVKLIINYSVPPTVK